jgi:hypothetical protein
MSDSVALLATMAAGVMIVVGCSDGRPRTYPVQGRIRFEDGRPVPFGVVEFRSASYGGRTARGEIDQRGHFNLRTFADNDGALPGEHKVVVVQYLDPTVWKNSSLRKPPAAPEHERHSNQTVLVDRRYADYRTSDLAATVKPQSDNAIELVVGKSFSTQEKR